MKQCEKKHLYGRLRDSNSLCLGYLIAEPPYTNILQATKDSAVLQTVGASWAKSRKGNKIPTTELNIILPKKNFDDNKNFCNLIENPRKFCFHYFLENLVVFQILASKTLIFVQDFLIKITTVLHQLSLWKFVPEGWNLTSSRHGIWYSKNWYVNHVT